MKLAFDTSVLVAVGNHPRHEEAVTQVELARQEEHTGAPIPTFYDGWTLPIEIVADNMTFRDADAEEFWYPATYAPQSPSDSSGSPSPLAG